MVLSWRNLHKDFGGRRAVDGLSFDVRAGEAYGLLAPNGAGKTTTIRMVCGILDPDRGQVTLSGEPIGRNGKRATLRRLGYVPQSVAVLPTLTLRENSHRAAPGSTRRSPGGCSTPIAG